MSQEITKIIDVTDCGVIEQDILEDLDLILRKSYLDFFTRIVKANPVDTGRSRGNWRCDFNKFDEKADYNHFDKTGTRTIKKIQKKMVKPTHSPLTDSYTLSNMIHYVGLLENGWSKQAPAGMVRCNLDAFEECLVNAIREVNK